MTAAIEEDVKKKMKKTIDLLIQELAKLRTGRASPALLEGIKVEYYGKQVPINQVAAISIPEPKMIVIQPWDKNVLPEIEKAIYKSPTGLVPNNDGNLIRIPIPLLTEERRRDLIKLVHKLGEDTKVAVRNVRRDANEAIKKQEKDKAISEDESRQFSTRVQKITDENTKSIDDILKKKEKEVMEI
jgi:ribosome recycling factor